MIFQLATDCLYAGQKFSHELATQRALVLGESSSSKGIKKRKKKEVY